MARPKKPKPFAPPNDTVVIDYTNFRGERAMRRIRPGDIDFYAGGTDHHPQPGWYMSAVDIQKGVVRLFRMEDIHAWKQEA